MRKAIAAVCGCMVLGFATHAQTPPRQAWAIRNAPAELASTVQHADLVVASLQSALNRELAAALEQGGPGGAMQSCHIDVISITQRIARQEGVAAGRTSDRLRDPTNAPRPWAAGIVKQHAGRLARDVDGFVVDLGNAVGVLRPIAQRPMCASCHGPAEHFEPAVRAALLERYPSDRAVGFRNGEIRGWFWVEMPKLPRR